MFRLPGEAVEVEEEQGERRERQESSGGQHQDNVLYQNYMPSYPYGFPFDYLPSNRQNLRRVVDPLLLSIEVAFTVFVDTMGRVAAKQKQETELLLTLFIDCINKNY